MTPRRVNLFAALAGVVSATVAVALGDLIAQLAAEPGSSPLFAVGAWVIDIVPGWVKETAIALFGTGDKIALLVGLGLLVLILAVGVGILQYHRPPWGVVALVAVGVVAGGAAVTRAGASASWLLPTVFGVVGGVVVLRVLVDRLHRWTRAVTDQSAKADGVFVSTSRRGFLTVLASTAAIGVVAAVASRAMSAATSAVNTVREALVLPKPTTAMAAIPTGADLGIPGMSALVVSNDTFYRIDTAIQVPRIDPFQWKLKITGMVETEIEIGYEELLALPMQETAVTIMCVSNEIGGDLIGNAVWLGHPIRNLLAQAGPKSGADMVLSTSQDGFSASTPLDVLLDEKRDALFAVGMNGEPLPIAHGFPVRMVVPGLYGYVSATKWVTELKVTRFADEAAYWTVRGWSPTGPIKTSSRIDVPRSGKTIGAGTVPIAGYAWAQHTGITGVDVRIDGGDWTPARLADAISADTWVQWVYEWNATSGAHVIEARATDAAGGEQSGTPVPVIPDGAEGYHTISVTVA
jgi:DMSO/TMAO reductase YedYZ molybdopterin-dependent catalytic subunit